MLTEEDLLQLQKYNFDLLTRQEPSGRRRLRYLALAHLKDGKSAFETVFPQHGPDGETLLKCADIAMYAAKTSAKGICHFFEPSQERRLVMRLNREAVLKQAVGRGELVLH